MKIIDRRKNILKHPTKKPGRRKKSDIRYIAVHHSLTTVGDADAFANYHIRKNNWSAMGYTYVIKRNGDIEWCADWEIITPHVGNSNKHYLGVCLVGDFRKQEPTKEQYKALYELLEMLMKELKIPIENVRGHQELPQYSWKQCPALDMDELRGNLKTKNYVPVRNNYNNDLKIEFKYTNIAKQVNESNKKIMEDDNMLESLKKLIEKATLKPSAERMREKLIKHGLISKDYEIKNMDIPYFSMFNLVLDKIFKVEKDAHEGKKEILEKLVALEKKIEEMEKNKNCCCK
jgi:N-acetyl-anhydromuramyl-L-alanine amidase AmpD